MSEHNVHGRSPGFLASITCKEVVTIVPILGMGLIAWGALTTDFKALAQRVDKGDQRDEKTADALDLLKGAVIELRVDGKATRVEVERLGRQLDRIEGIVRNISPPQRNPTTP